MSYQVLARKWRPQRFDDVVGQQAVTRTLRNALTSGRIAQAFVFAGSRGCGKTTTARILARALNCVTGPTPDPCGACDACIEIAQGRDIDVLEIDAASHTGIDNIREVVIAGLSIAPVRDRYKVFIIDEVHQLSTPSFNALLKSIEEPPAHVVFMMATTELHKIPDTILSRSQVFEFRSIPTKAIAEQLRRIADAESIQVEDGALALIARAAEGSMRDGQSAFDQVISFAGSTITVDDVSSVLGLIGRDLLFDLVEAVLDEDAPRAFALADRAVESGHDLRLVCRELSALVRDLMIVSVDPARATGEIAEGERERVAALAKRFSREDLMRAFDVLAKAEGDIRNASQPRYHLEMALLRWMHLQKLVPLTELLSGGGVPAAARSAASRAAGGSVPAAGTPASSRTVSPRSAPPRVSMPPSSGPTPGSERVSATTPPARASAAPAAAAPPSAGRAPAGTSALKDALLAEIRAARGFFYNTVVAQAQKIDVAEDRVTFTFLPAHRALREQFEGQRAWIETAAERLSGHKVTVTAVQAGTGSAAGTATDATGAQMASSASAPLASTPPAAREDAGPEGSASGDARDEALASPAVRDLLDVFPAEIRKVEELKS